MRVRSCLLAFVLFFAILPVPARAASLFPPYKYEGEMRYAASGLAAGTRVRLYEAEHEKHYTVSTPSGGRVRVPWDAVMPIAVPSPALREPSAAEIADFVGERMHSRTGVLLWVDLARVRVYLLEYGDEGWTLVRTLRCSVGDAAHPTPSGRFEIAYRSASIGKENLYLCRHALCFYGGYMLHSVLYDWAGESVTDGRLGERISHGCIRLSPKDSEYLYRTVPIGTAVYVR
ncbi:MAG: L,D-transpeptidase [Clostridia bacterium]|nr:L,D-transpeptidase [Clostridia bacterium]